MKYFKAFNIIVAAILIATAANGAGNYISTASALEKYNSMLKNKSFIIYPESRDNPIKWVDSIPEKKLSASFRPKQFLLAARPGEYFVYQVGLWALKYDLSDVRVEFTDLVGRDGKTVSSGVMTCFNTGGVNNRGEPFTKRVDVAAGLLQALWIGIDLDGVKPGIYDGSVKVIAKGEKQTIPLRLELSGEVIADHGYGEGNKLTRLSWLNSTAGIDEEITKGYLPVRVGQSSVSILGRTLNIAGNGLPESVITYFGPSNQSLLEKGEPVVENPFRFIIQKADGSVIQLQPGKLEFFGQSPSKIGWRVLNTSKECELECAAQMEFDGFVDYRLKLRSKIPLKISDIRLEIPVVKGKAEYMMGLNHEGGFRCRVWKWKWDVVNRHQDILWVGAVNGGIRIKWKAENYIRPLINGYYAGGRLNLPPSWGNEGKGGIDVEDKNGDAVITAYSGYREMQKGDVLNYNFELLITPLKLIDKMIKFRDRYYHGGGTVNEKIEGAKNAGANIVVVHHNSDINPFINYPFIDGMTNEQIEAVADAHKNGLRMKFYYTTRELTTYLPELWAFKSLNGEIIYPNPENIKGRVSKNDWVVRNLREKYIPAWNTVIRDGKYKGEADLSVITAPDSRFNNFYVAGLDWMIRNIGIDGIYIDDTALDRFALRRARKIIDGSRPEGRIDFHSWNHFSRSAGFTNCLNLYMDLLPYFDFLWIGEGQDYNRSHDRWLIEVSGIPFGLPGQMLGYGGNPVNPWRGMVYGITTRAGRPDLSPVEIWKFWDEHKIEKKEMIGYWDKNSPVSCFNTMVKASVYRGIDESLIAVANWSKDEQPVSIEVDFEKLGYDPADCEISIPEINDFQNQKQFPAFSLDRMIVPGGKGCIILIKKRK